MIIACPKCSGPYQLPDDQVAPLVQVQCPHCEYRVILDFAAANDPSLREPEMLMADGFRSEDDYQKALADGHKVATYDLPAPPPPQPKPERVAPTTPAVAARTTSTPASRPQPTPVLETPSTSSLLSGSSLDTSGTLSDAVRDFARASEPEPEVKPEPVAEVKAPEPEVKAPEPESKPEPAVESKPESRTPPHTPPVTPTAKEPPPPDVRPVEGRPIEPAAESGKRPIEKTPEKVVEKAPETPAKTPETEGRGLGLVLVVFLVILAVVFGLTYAKTGTLDPRLLIQSLQGGGAGPK
ncbi:MAG: zinc-ribbon domain-containing protein [Nannocystaceae bacterium]